jgi:hypothetical protein
LATRHRTYPWTTLVLRTESDLLFENRACNAEGGNPIWARESPKRDCPNGLFESRRFHSLNSLVQDFCSSLSTASVSFFGPSSSTTSSTEATTRSEIPFRQAQAARAEIESEQRRYPGIIDEAKFTLSPSRTRIRGTSTVTPRKSTNSPFQLATAKARAQ